jgi:hypothetical protein
VFNNLNFTAALAPPDVESSDRRTVGKDSGGSGDKPAAAEKNHQKEVVIRLLEQLAHYVRGELKGRHDDFSLYWFHREVFDQNQNSTGFRIDP